MGIDIKVNAFEGPLDLLLHLIEKNKVDIYDIPMRSQASILIISALWKRKILI